MQRAVNECQLLNFLNYTDPVITESYDYGLHVLCQIIAEKPIARISKSYTDLQTQQKQ
jgi:hypothetical protein